MFNEKKFDDFNLPLNSTCLVKRIEFNHWGHREFIKRPTETFKGTFLEPASFAGC